MKKTVWGLICGLICLPALGDTPLTEEQLREKAETFISAKNARQQPDTKIEDIDYFLSLFADEFVDEHIRFNVTVTSKEDLREGMIRKMDDEIFYSNIRIDQVMFGRNVAFVKYTESAKVKPTHMDEPVEYTSTNIVSLEYNDDGLITHLRRHHGL